MCGIFGVIRHNSTAIPASVAERMAATLRHRGPDHTGFYIAPNIVLGNTRLSIIDLAGGNQPIYNEGGDLVIVFNGEIYNHHEIRERLASKGHKFRTSSDTEVIIHAYETYGVDCVHYLDGMFAFAIWDIGKQELFLARDPLGIKPLYFLETDDTFAFASEPKTLLALLAEAPRPNWAAINRFFSFGYFPLEDCGFAGIRKFRAGHFGCLKERRFIKTCYWQPSYKPHSPRSFETAVEQVMDLAEKVVAKELQSDVPVGVFLSGGLDSSLVALSASRITHGKVPSFSLGFEESTHDESEHARAIADHLGLEHFSYRLTRDELCSALFRVNEKMDEPFADSTVLPLLVLSEFARKHIKVALTGWGGDELFAGYPTYKAHQFAMMYRRLPGVLGKWLIPSIVNKLPVSEKYMSFEFKAKKFIQGMDLPPEQQHFVWMGYFDDQAKNLLFKKQVRDKMEEKTVAPVEDVIDTLDEEQLVDRILHLDALTFLEGNGLYQADRMSMAASLEARVPLLNKEMVEFATKLPVELKMKGGVMKAILKEALRPHLPAYILRLPKKGFSPPSASWLRGVFRETVENQMSRNRIEDAGVFEYTEVRRLLDDHMTKRNNGRSLWLLLSFQLWYNKYFSN